MTERYTLEFEALVRAWARARVDEERWPHVCGVVEFAAELAGRYAPEQGARVRLAGWIHDAAKNWADADLLAYAETHGLPVTASERAVPMLLHGAVGYALADAAFDLGDDLLRRACAGHTTGAAVMSAAEKIVFVADFAEPTRPARRAAPIRAAAEQSLDAATLCTVDHILRHRVAGRVTA